MPFYRLLRSVLANIALFFSLGKKSKENHNDFFREVFIRDLADSAPCVPSDLKLVSVLCVPCKNHAIFLSFFL